MDKSAARTGEFSQLARLGRFLLPYRWRIVLALGALVVAASCVLALGQGLRDAFNGASPGLLPVIVLLVWALGAGLLTARTFRWE